MMNSNPILAMRWSSSIEKDSDSGSLKDPATKKMKPSRDPQSHRVIEKRRRDRMNQSLSDLSRLIPAAYLKKGQSRVEKAEIIELATQHLVALSAQLKKCEASMGTDFPRSESSCCVGKFFLGFREASKSAVTFLNEQEGLSSNDPLCCKLRAHLQTLSQRVLPDEATPQPTAPASEAKSGPSEEAQQSLPAHSASCCSTDEAHSDASFDAGCGPSVDDIKKSRRDPKRNFRERFEAEVAKSREGRKRQAASPLPEAGERSPDYRDRVRLLGGLGETVEEANRTAKLQVAELLLPGFVLHESGTFYEPMVVSQSSLGVERLSRCGKPLHPVSIPVNFRTTRFVRCHLPPDA
ncbi:hypothetical protein BOX15_Mlig023497g1 [Macrostomum lignano]|uniref:BHLH domain-containing protein n=2 Tax=Macrostomum lignano TaxID=282301 RepID=A0A267DUP6_9PLAT|nr:hypothetical protein BOX15_Mlig023497g3 [Macrostomum lignano]PAA54829.1 hypothetical protein BOX15_Mlig023497g1 [Macrostomum lignano]